MALADQMPAPLFPPQLTLRAACSRVSVLLLDCDEEARERRAYCLRRWGHPIQTYTRPNELPLLSQLPGNAVLIVRQELPQELGMECVQRFQKARSDVPAILLTSTWSSALAAAASSSKAVWLRRESLSDEELHVLVDLCSAA
jgi:DNA-binding NtrC family response regulator